MKRRAAVTAALASAALAAALAGSASASHPGSQTLTFVERNNQGTFRYIDIAPRSTRRGEPSVSVGDMFVGTNPLYDAANRQREGKLFFKCTAVLGARRFARSVFLCEATARLSNGTLAVSAVLNGDASPAGPVIGGTGAYEGASGSFASDERRRTAVDTFHFDTD
ncbi:MAG: hypothetical protein QOH58_975 [Thermoleophilaceae bacterium]|jgi:hypothetical protein|nr:hypothetical protein [Thermoleophilaceae bacterium]